MGVEPPCFPLAGLMLLIRYRPVRPAVRPAERPPGAPPTMFTPRGCVDVCARARGCACARTCARARGCVGAPVRVSVRVVVSCSRGCTRGGLVFAWCSRGPPECYSITKGQRLERRQTIGPKRPSWSPRGHLVVTSWSPRGHLVPHDHPMITLSVCRW